VTCVAAAPASGRRADEALPMKPAIAQKRIEGVLAPVITPFRRDLSPDADRFVRHCRWLMKSGCAGLAVFGTNSEANSMSVEEKLELLDALVKGGVPPATLMPGTGHCALGDSVKMTREVVRMGCGGVLMLPPFYYKGVSDEGLFRSFSEVIERVGDERLRLYLYHIPPVSSVAISLELIERLLARYPGIVAGAKDSSGDWNNTQAMLERFKDRGFDVFPGSEVFLLEGLRAGGKGCITATGNVNVFRREHFVAMPDGAIMANSGHFDAELDLKALRALAEGHVREVRENVQEFDLGPKKLHLLAEGRLVNLGAAEGHPAAVMDMSFANQALCAEYVAGHHAELESRVYVVPEAIDQEVARLKLEALGHHIDGMTAEQEAYTNSWKSGT
jgi:4-hydroxy-tetrahydrodipicolinate synthase